MKTGIASFLVAGLLVLAGISFDARPASAQTQEACPLPPGVTLPADPTVTAQQVEDGSASLKDFALAARDQLKKSGGVLPYLLCAIRQEGGPHRSGSTYLVQLTMDGRVYVHSKSMSLSGRLLNPLIYAEILSALGVSPALLTALASSDPSVAAGAFRALYAALAREPDAPFDAVSLAPGASGHAVGFLEVTGNPIVMLAGFDLDESHLAEEEIDHGDPAITARDVVNRSTLKAFVMEAGEYFGERMAAGGSAATQAKVAMRDPDGPWRHGSVYLYIMFPYYPNQMIFHAAFPDRFEFRPLVPTVRDAVTGEFVLPQVLDAAESSPEGGFVEYHFDDPDDDTDSADVRKVAYAREFSANYGLPDGTSSAVNFIIVSGFYHRLPEGVDARFVARLLDGLAEGEPSLLFGITTPADEDSVAGNAVTLSATGAPTDEVHFAFRPVDDLGAGFAYLDAAANQGSARLPWDTLPLPDGDYELAALFTEDEGDSITFDTIEVTVDNDGPAQAPDILENDGLKTQALRMGELHEVVTADGVVVTVPAGALAGDDRLTIMVTEPPEATTAPGDAVGTGVAISLAGGEATFAEAVTIALPYPDGESDGLVDDTSIPETDLSLWYFDDAADAWERISGSSVQSDTNLVVADVRRTGEYGIFDAPLPRGGGGGCAALPVLPGGPSDPTLPGLVALVTLYLLFGRRPRRQAALG